MPPQMPILLRAVYMLRACCVVVLMLAWRVGGINSNDVHAYSELRPSTPEFTFPTFRLRKSSREAKTIKTIERYCSRSCKEKHPGRGRVNMECTRRCLADKSGAAECYRLLYEVDPLEDGEVDAGRFRSFKGCVAQNVKQGRNHKEILLRLRHQPDEL